LWASGDVYEPYVGRWSRLVAKEFVAWLDTPGLGNWLDVGCGTGALSSAILALAAPRALTGIDASEGFVEYAKAHVQDPRAHFQTGDARSLPFADGSFDAAVSGLVINFVPEPSTAVSEMARVVRPDGVIAVYVWDYSGGMQLMRRFWDAALALDPGALAEDEARRFAICQPEPLVRLFSDAGGRDVEVRAIEIPTVFRDFDDYWTPFLGGQAPAPKYAMSLDEEHRSALREKLRAELPTQSDGSIALTARAWAVRGHR
jgi:SAM-dependent methyltransferase